MLMDELQGMGESNAAIGRRPSLSRDTFLAAAAGYHTRAWLDDLTPEQQVAVLSSNAADIGTLPPDAPAMEDTHITATFQVCINQVLGLTIDLACTACELIKARLHVACAQPQVIYMIGWSPHESQQRADRRGTATRSLSSLGSVKVTKTEAGSIDLMEKK